MGGNCCVTLWCLVVLVFCSTYQGRSWNRLCSGCEVSAVIFPLQVLNVVANDLLCSSYCLVSGHGILC